MELSLDWAQISTIVTLVVVMVLKAWKSRELEAIRTLVLKLEEEKFEEVRRHNATKRQVQIIRDELDEYRKSEVLKEEDQEERNVEEEEEETDNA